MWPFSLRDCWKSCSKRNVEVFSLHFQPPGVDYTSPQTPKATDSETYALYLRSWISSITSQTPSTSTSLVADGCIAFLRVIACYMYTIKNALQKCTYCTSKSTYCELRIGQLIWLWVKIVATYVLTRPNRGRQTGPLAPWKLFIEVALKPSYYSYWSVHKRCWPLQLCRTRFTCRAI